MMKDAGKLVDSGKPITVAVLGSHSALEVCAGAKAHGFRTLVIAEKGREKVYVETYRTRKENGKTLGVVDETIVLGKFKEILSAETISRLNERNSVFVTNRSFQVYTDFDYDAIEDEFSVPILGSRRLLRAEERNQPKNQYHLLQKAGLKHPKQFKSHDEIDRLCIVKVNEASRGFERSFFFASTPEEYERKAMEKILKGEITKPALENAIIEEFAVGVPVNLNFFYSPVAGRTELLGTDTRRQTSLDGILRLPAAQQLDLSKQMQPSFEEAGHCAVTVLESLLGKIQDMGEKFVSACKEEYPPGIIGPFALQCAVTPGPPGKELVVFDVSLRMPGSPGIQYTPYSSYLHGESFSAGRRLAMELRNAVDCGKLSEVLT